MSPTHIYPKINDRNNNDKVNRVRRYYECSSK